MARPWVMHTPKPVGTSLVATEHDKHSDTHLKYPDVRYFVLSERLRIDVRRVMPTEQPVRTAQPKYSIWKDLSEDAFRRTVIALSRATGAVPDDSRHWWSPSNSNEQLHASIEPRTLRSQTEQRLADDFAFILASQRGADSVTAVCIEEIHEPLGVVLRVAANEGVGEGVQTALRHICDCLMSCAKTDLPLEGCISQLSSSVLSLSQHRIISRMRLFLGPSPARRTSPKVANDSRLRRTLTRMRARALTSAAVNLVGRIAQLESRFKKVLRQGNSNLTRELEGVLVECYSITTSDGAVPFRTTLRKAGLSPHEWFNNKLIMQIDKLAAYHRIPMTLASEVYRKGARALFSNIRIEYLDPYKSRQSAVSLTGKKVRCHVHAEVQLVVHYLRSTILPPPRFIGTSKEACFLCHLLIVEHGCFSVSTWHGRLFDQWTIPDLATYSPEDTAILRAIIHRMHDRCLQLLAATHPKRQLPLTSRHNLHDFPKFSPTSTVLSAKHALKSDHVQAIDPKAELASGASHQNSYPALSASHLIKTSLPTIGMTTPRPSSHEELSDNVVESPPTRDSRTGKETSSDEWDECWESNSMTSMSSNRSTRVVHLVPDRPRFITLSDLRIMTQIQPPSSGMMTLRRHSSVVDIPTSHVVELDELLAGQDVILERGENETCIVLRFRKGNNDLYRIELKWS